MTQRLSRKAFLYVSLWLVMGVSSAVLAQDKKDHSVAAVAATEQARFLAASEIVSLRLEVFTLGETRLYDSDFKPGNLLDWNWQDAQGQRLSDGTYRCLLTVKDLTGRSSQRQGVLLIQNGEASWQVPEQAETALRNTAVAERIPYFATVANPSELAAAVLAHDGTGARLMTGSGGLSVRSGNFLKGNEQELMRLNSDGKLDLKGLISTTEGVVFPDGTVQKTAYLASGQTLKQLAEDDKPVKSAPNVGGSGTPNQLMKWAANGVDATDSSVTDNGPGGGITVNGGVQSTFYEASASGTFLSFKPAIAGSAFLLRSNSLSGNIWIGHLGNVGLNASEPASRFATGGGATIGAAYYGNIAPTNGLLVEGNVGIGNTAPSAKLDVTGSINATQYNVFGLRFMHNTGTDNTFVGRTAGNAISTGAQNTFIGHAAGDLNTTGAKNTFVGEDAGGSNTSGEQNVFVGENAGVLNSLGNDNVALGHNAGDTISTGNLNTLIGKNADVSLSTLTNATALGANAQVAASNSLVLGGINGTNSGTSVNVGIGTPEPKTKLHLLGDVQDDITIRGTRIGSGGTFAAPMATLDGNNLLALEGNGHTGSGFSNPMAAIRLRASQNWAVGATGTFIAFETTANNTTSVTERVRINANGTVEVNVLGSAGAEDVCRNGNNALSTCSSSRRYKDNILPFKSGLNLVSKLRPVTFDWKGGAADLGLVAEEVAAVEPLLTVYNDKGEIEGVKYKQLNVVLINAMKELQMQNAALLKRLETIERVLVRKKHQRRSR